MPRHSIARQFYLVTENPAESGRAETMSTFKIVIIGAVSIGFTKKLFTDILCVPELQDIEVALTDISERNLSMIKAILNKIVEFNKLPTKVTATTDRRKAIEGARYIMSC